tara:strand:+ start:699 stop:896 length:198 start_codon:yes stop_codon:yes gene_type:complete
MIEKARKLPLLTKIILTIILSLIWIFIASSFDLDIKSNWILSVFVIAGISSIFFPFGKKNKPSDK